jgi:hypothetical protein
MQDEVFRFGDEYWLSVGKHRAGHGHCAMEWVAYIAGEKHSDSPKCVSPLLREFFWGLNDRLRDADRQRLRPYLARTIGTAHDDKEQWREAMMRNFVRSHRARWEQHTARVTIHRLMMSPIQGDVADAAAVVGALYPELGIKFLDELLPCEILDLQRPYVHVA